MDDNEITAIVGWPTEPEMAKFRKVVAAASAAERERCAAVLRARIEKIAAEAERAAISEPDEESALRAMAWQLTVAEREILGPNE